MNNLTLIIAIFTTALALVQTYFVIIQTLKLRNIKKIRDTHLKHLLSESRDLASHLWKHAEGNKELILGAEKAQQMQKNIWLLIVNIFDLTIDDVEKMKNDLGEYEYSLVKGIVKDMKSK